MKKLVFIVSRWRGFANRALIKFRRTNYKFERAVQPFSFAFVA